MNIYVYTLHTSHNIKGGVDRYRRISPLVTHSVNSLDVEAQDSPKQFHIVLDIHTYVHMTSQRFAPEDDYYCTDYCNDTE